MSAAANARSRRAAIVLAGGEGTRLQSFTKSVTGRSIPKPKQYFPISATETMLQWTLRRVSLGIARRSILSVVAAAHAEFYESQLTDVDEQSPCFSRHSPKSPSIRIVGFGEGIALRPFDGCLTRHQTAVSGGRSRRTRPTASYIAGCTTMWAVTTCASRKHRSSSHDS